MEASTREASYIPKLYDFMLKQSIVWKYFGFIKVKDGPVTKPTLI